MNVDTLTILEAINKTVIGGGFFACTFQALRLATRAVERDTVALSKQDTPAQQARPLTVYGETWTPPDDAVQYRSEMRDFLTVMFHRLPDNLTRADIAHIARRALALRDSGRLPSRDNITDRKISQGQHSAWVRWMIENGHGRRGNKGELVILASGYSMLRRVANSPTKRG